jgi:hypothetical protein
VLGKRTTGYVACEDQRAWLSANKISVDFIAHAKNFFDSSERVGCTASSAKVLFGTHYS